LNDDSKSALSGTKILNKSFKNDDLPSKSNINSEGLVSDKIIERLSNEKIKFPPCSLIGIAPEVSNSNYVSNLSMFRRRPEHTVAAAASIAANLLTSARVSSNKFLPFVAARHIIDCLGYLSKTHHDFA